MNELKEGMLVWFMSNRFKKIYRSRKMYKFKSINDENIAIIKHPYKDFYQVPANALRPVRVGDQVQAFTTKETEGNWHGFVGIISRIKDDFKVVWNKGTKDSEGNNINFTCFGSNPLDFCGFKLLELSGKAGKGGGGETVTAVGQPKEGDKVFCRLNGNSKCSECHEAQKKEPLTIIAVYESHVLLQTLYGTCSVFEHHKYLKPYDTFNNSNGHVQRLSDGYVEGKKVVKFRKKAIVVNAEQWWPDDHPLKPKDALPELSIVEVTRWDEKPCYGWIVTLEGGHVVTPGDWIITGIEGEKYPCKDDIFRKTYEPIDED